MSDHTFTLKDPIDFMNKDGEKCQGSILHLFSPPAKSKDVPIRLRAAYAKASKRAATSDLFKDDDIQEKIEDAKEQKADSQEEDDGKSIIQLLYMMIPDDMGQVHKDFKLLITSPAVVVIENEISLTSSLYDKVPQSDIDKLLGYYLANFMIPLWTS